MVHPGCSGGGFDDVQDLHEKRVVMAQSLTNAVKQYRKRGRRAECKGVKQARIEVDGAGYKS